MRFWSSPLSPGIPRLRCFAVLSLLGRPFGGFKAWPPPRAGGGAGGGTRATVAVGRRAVFFTADGMRQDIVAKYAAKGLMPTMSKFLKHGISATGNGLLTQAPPNTGAGWYSLATGAWPGVHGSTNNTFHINGQPFANRTTAFDPNVLQAESIAQSAERGGLKVAQVEWAGGRNATIQGPTIDFQSFFSGRGVATNFIGNAGQPLFDDAPFIAAFGLQFDTPAGYAGQAPFPGAAPVNATGWSSVPTSFSPAKEMRLRVLDFGVDKYGLNAYIFDSRNDHKTKYDKVLFSPTKSGADSVGILKKGELADVKVKIVGGALAGQTAGMLVKVEELTDDLSRVRLFHTSVSRAIASWPTWPGEPGFTGDFAEFLAQKFPTSTAADFAILEAGVTSEETYVEQGLYWATGHTPMLKYVVDTYKPDLLLAGMPTTDEFQHQFLGLVSKKLPGGAPNPAYDDVDLNGVPDHRVDAREGFLRAAYQEADEVLTLARKLMGRDPTTFVASDHGFAPQFLAIDASQALVELGLLSKPQTSNCRPATGETIGKAKACWAGGAVQIYLNLAGRDPAGGGFIQVAAGDIAATVAAIKAKYLGLVDPNDWTHDGHPEGWKVIDRAFTKAEARYIPNGPNSTSDMAHPTRTGDLVAFAFPPYQFDAETPGTLVAPSAFFGQHGYVPDVQDLAANVNMRATFLAGGNGIDDGHVTARTIDLAPTLAFLLDIPEPQHSQGKVLLDVVDGGSYKALSIVGLNDFHGQLEPDDARLRRDQPARRRRLVPRDDVRRGTGLATRSRADPRRRRQRRCVTAQLAAPRGHARDRRRERLGPRRDLVRQPRVRLRRRAAPGAAGAGPLPVPGDEHRRDGERQRARLGDAVEGLHRRRRQGRRHRRRAPEHPGARLRRRDGRPDVPAGGGTDQGRVRAAPAPRHQGADRRHPPGNKRRHEHHRQRRRRSVAGSDPPDRRRPPGHDGGRHARRAHPPGIEPDARPHPGHRGDQRGGELLGGPADRSRRRRAMGRGGHAGGEDPRRRRTGRTSRRSSTTRTPRPRSFATR